MDISNQKTEVECPKCKSKFKITIKQVANQANVNCSKCNQPIQLVDDRGSTKKAIKDINKAFKDFEKTLKKWGK